MSASVCEQILARVHAVLIAADIVGDRIFRNRTDALGDDEIPGIKILRGSSESMSHGRDVERTQFEFSLECIVGSANVETVSDALHVAAHAALMRDPDLARLGVGLRCISTESFPDGASIDANRLAARYQIHFLTRAGDMSRPIQ